MSNISDGAIVMATVVGPVLAVQAQKWVERTRERRSRKDWIFNVLMANRRHRYSAATLPVLNSIEVAFYGGRGLFGQSRRDHAVTEKWAQLLAHLTPNPRLESDDPRFETWTNDADRLFFELLHAMCTSLGYKFEISELRRGGYVPESQATAEIESQAMRSAAVKWLEGNSVIHVVTHAPMPRSAEAPVEAAPES